MRNNSNVQLIDHCGLAIEKVFGDLNDASFVEEVMKNIFTVLRIAGVHTSLNVVKAAVHNNVQRLILVHTTGIYSKFKSASSGYIETENRIEKILAHSNVDVTILRPTMIYGSMADINVIVFIKMVDKLRLFPVVNHASILCSLFMKKIWAMHTFRFY